MFKITFALISISTFSLGAFAADKNFCHFNYEMITNSDVAVDPGVQDQASNSPGSDAIFFYEVSYSVYSNNTYTRKTLAQLDCEDSKSDKEAFKQIMLENCESIHMGGISVPMSKDFDFSKACG